MENSQESHEPKQIQLLLLATAQLLFLGMTAHAVETPPITMVINRVAQPPIIDGTVDDVCWENAQWMPLQNVQGDAVKVGGRIALAFDETNLYAAFVLDEPTPDKINAPLGAVNTKEIWTGEILEWFINPVPQGAAYVQLGWNPGGARYNAKCDMQTSLESIVTWGPKWKAAAKIGKSGWTSEAVISFAELGQKPPMNGAVWTMNLCRTRNIEGHEYSCLSSTFSKQFRGFHFPRGFAEVCFNRVVRDALPPANSNIVRLTMSGNDNELLRAWGITFGPNLARGGDAESATTAWGPQVKVTPDAKRRGNAGYELDVINGRATSDDLIPIVHGTTYRLSGYFRSADMQKPASAYFGLQMYDAQKRMITLAAVVAHKETETTLTRAANVGDTVVAIQNGATWKGGCIAFNIMDEYRDLPNFDRSGEFTLVEKHEGFYEVRLQTPLTKSYPAGTRVREHAPWGATLYWVADGWLTAEWEQYGTYIGGEAKFGGPTDKFWANAKYMRIFVQLGNYNRVPVKGAKLWIDDIRLEEISVK
ncbi:MAG: sugar-binding protein [Phycisphaerae bacterium]